MARVFTHGSIEAAPAEERFKQREAGEENDERVP